MPQVDLIHVALSTLCTSTWTSSCQDCNICVALQGLLRKLYLQTSKRTKHEGSQSMMSSSSQSNKKI